MSYLVIAVGCASSRTSWALELPVADFNSGEKPNLLGGDFGSWDKDPNDPTQHCAIAFDPLMAYGKSGYALRVDYDVDSPNPAYNGVWMKIEHVDLRPYKQLVFYIKGDPQAGFTPQLKLELKNAKETGRYLLRGITESWQEVVVPLSAFEGVSDWSQMTELVLVFDDITSTKRVGTLYLDEIRFR